MNILFIGDEDQMEEINSLKSSDQTSLFYERVFPENVEQFDVIFFLDKKFFSDEEPKLFNKLIIVNDVIASLPASPSPLKIARINGWPTFLGNDTWEVATNYPEEFKIIFALLNKDVVIVNDHPGMISPRVISRIINEAYYALKEEVSTKEEIDLAMKNGTNYPFGPFEWSEKIGLQRVYDLLKKLSENDDSYTPAFKP